MRHLALTAILVLTFAACGYREQPRPTARRTASSTYTVGDPRGWVATYAANVDDAGTVTPIMDIGTTSTGNALLTSQVSNADSTSTAAAVLGCHTVWVTATISGSSSPVGSLYVLGSEDGSHFSRLYFDASKVYGSTNGAVYAHAAGAAIPYTGAADSDFLIPVENPPPHIEVNNDWASAGTTGNRVNVRYSCQGN